MKTSKVIKWNGENSHKQIQKVIKTIVRIIFKSLAIMVPTQLFTLYVENSTFTSFLITFFYGIIIILA